MKHSYDIVLKKLHFYNNFEWTAQSCFNGKDMLVNNCSVKLNIVLRSLTEKALYSQYIEIQINFDSGWLIMLHMETLSIQ